jgi:hypothetical protein
MTGLRVNDDAPLTPSFLILIYRIFLCPFFFVFLFFFFFPWINVFSGVGSH